MKWIPANERLPAKLFGTIARFSHTKTILFDFVEWVRQKPEALNVVEWLDESEPSLEDQDVLWDEVAGISIGKNKEEALPSLKSLFTLTRK